ncbi:auxin response factor 17-like isoform X3 [Telopea speciosissima]|uniref:auxin response factor 17-like isoform X2 n=1 Tax=Telopea speciosissima TaxID=54955 RepID=UPI001CC7B770|nr:auxin response factor 17-like isoform X2 [Telopea speciosissima]XP_043712770.1 auxin response factor 17-like isoform X3 [Telopea speciosissima]
MASGIANMLRTLDPSIWKACAGNSIEIPTVDSRVYYFPQGHAEQASSPPDFSSLTCAKPCVLCRILSVRFLANPDTDEVFAKIRLQPLNRSCPPGIHIMSPVRTVSDGESEDKIVSFAKILTPSDANNGGGFSVPRFCADSIFPPLDYKAEPPVQNIDVTDVHGMVWEFRHIYRGTPRRHLLTTGWSKFVNHKKLVAGDSVVFMKNRRGELFVGVRRTARFAGSFDSMRWNCQYIGASVGVKVEEFGNSEGFTRTGKGKVSPESVVEAAELAGAGMPFEIVYYPKAGSPDFVVKAEIVDESMFWTTGMTTAGMRVKMSLETQDSSRMTWFQGTVSAAVQYSGPWYGSPWRILQVTWDEPEILQDLERVSPWQVELIATPSSLQAPFPPTKRLRVPQNHDLLNDGEESLYFPMAELTNSVMGNLSSSLFNYNSFPAGMQGARQDSYYVSGFSNFIANNSHQMYIDHLHGNMTPKSSVSTELNIGSTSQSDNSSPHSQSSVHFFAADLSSNRKCSSPTESGSKSFRLFGKLIHTNQPVESRFDDAGCSEDDGCKGYKENEVINNPVNPSSFSCNKLYNGLNVPCQKVSTVETCSL